MQSNLSAVIYVTWIPERVPFILTSANSQVSGDGIQVDLTAIWNSAETYHLNGQLAQVGGLR